MIPLIGRFRGRRVGVVLGVNVREGYVTWGTKESRRPSGAFSPLVEDLPLIDSISRNQGVRSRALVWSRSESAPLSSSRALLVIALTEDYESPTYRGLPAEALFISWTSIHLSVWSKGYPWRCVLTRETVPPTSISCCSLVYIDWAIYYPGDYQARRLGS